MKRMQRIRSFCVFNKSESCLRFFLITMICSYFRIQIWPKLILKDIQTPETLYYQQLLKTGKYRSTQWARFRTIFFSFQGIRE